MRIDVTKRLVHGKKITIEGRKGRWVQLKYERLPNFCYRCGFLNHTLKDWSEPGEQTAVGGDEELLYGAWLRGEFVRRSSNNPSFFGPTKGGGPEDGKLVRRQRKGRWCFRHVGTQRKKERITRQT